jgi:hypothetical protein
MVDKLSFRDVLDQEDKDGIIARLDRESRKEGRFLLLAAQDNIGKSVYIEYSDFSREQIFFLRGFDYKNGLARCESIDDKQIYTFRIDQLRDIHAYYDEAEIRIRELIRVKLLSYTAQSEAPENKSILN